MRIDDLQLVKRILEGAIMASETPLSKKAIKELFDDLECPVDELINQALEALAADCEERGYELKQVASGYRFQVKQDLSKWIGKLWKDKTPRYSRALLETLSLIAYRQPITRGEIESIRGVAVSSQIVRTLLERDWIKAVGHRDVPGKPAIYATTKEFLDYFNLKSLDQLPPLAEIRDLNAISKDFNIELPLELQEESETPAGDEANVDSAGDSEPSSKDDASPTLSIVSSDDVGENPSVDDELTETVSEDVVDDEVGYSNERDAEVLESDAETVDVDGGNQTEINDAPAVEEQQLSDLAELDRDENTAAADDENAVFGDWVASGLADAK